MSHTPIRVLVVDDYHDGAEMLGHLLRVAGCEVVVKIRGEQAVEAAKVLKPQLVILDLHMPGMDGFDTIAALKLIPLPDVTVYVAFSANNDPLVLAKVRLAGFHHFILKTSGFATFDTVLTSIRALQAG